MNRTNLVTQEIAGVMFKELGIDEIGLTKTDLKILKTLYDIGEPIGLDNLSVIVNESPKTLSSSIEPFLIQRGLMVRSGRGRKITKIGIQYLNKSNYLSKKLGKIEIDSGYARR
jgi:Holliday junction DNA helicase RuvB